MSSRYIVLALWCVLVTNLFAYAHTMTVPYPTANTSSHSVRATLSLDCSHSSSSSRSASDDAPETFTETTLNAAYTCNGDELARLIKLNKNNLHLQLQCIASSGRSSYVFPFNGELSYAQMVAMSAVNECTYYFRAVLLVQLQECMDSNVYIRTIAETILQLAVTSGSAPTEAEVNAAIAVRKTYNLAIRDGDHEACYVATKRASALSWNIEGNTIDTTASANTSGQLLLSTDLQIIGTYYASSNVSALTISNVQDVRLPGQRSPDISKANRKEEVLWLVMLTLACMTLLMH